MRKANQTMQIEEKEAPISRVIVMEDRAQVTRVLRRTFEMGAQTISLAGVSPLLVDRSLRVRLTQGTLVDFSIQRQIEIGAHESQKIKTIHDTIKEHLKTYTRAASDIEALHRGQQSTRTMAKVFAQFISEKIKFGQFNTQWSHDFDTLANSLSLSDEAIFDKQWAQDDLSIEIRRLFETFTQLDQPTRNHRVSLAIDFSFADAGEYDIEIEYQIPCALWRPQYRAALGDEMSWQSVGCVWQRTGEDWSDITLSFSTARPSLGAELSLLSDDSLSLTDKTSEEKKTVQIESHDDDIHVTSDGIAPITTDTPPGVDDGGETRTFTVPKPVTIPSDGCPHSFVFDSWTSACEASLLCTAERDPIIFLESRQKNASLLPLLAGPVALSRNGHFTGNASILFVAAGEDFTLSWGSEDELGVIRNQDLSTKDTKILQHHEYHFATQLYLSNRSSDDKIVELKERIPVSELAKVEVRIDDAATTQGYESDEHGILTWKRPISSGSNEKVTLNFTVSMPKNMVWNADPRS